MPFFYIYVYIWRSEWDAILIYSYIKDHRLLGVHIYGIYMWGWGGLQSEGLDLRSGVSGGGCIYMAAVVSGRGSTGLGVASEGPSTF